MYTKQHKNKDVASNLGAIGMQLSPLVLQDVRCRCRCFHIKCVTVVRVSGDRRRACAPGSTVVVAPTSDAFHVMGQISRTTMHRLMVLVIHPSTADHRCRVRLPTVDPFCPCWTSLAMCRL
jgi:hypothetical protein